MSDLQVPIEARVPLLNLGMKVDSWAHVDETVRAIAGPVVAAELRRLADEIGGSDYGRVAAQVMHQRADEVSR